MAADRERLSRWRALRDRREFEKIYGSGVKLVGRLLVLYLLPAADDAKAVVASRKVGGSVQRNRAKRLLRAGLAASSLGRIDGPAAVLERLMPPDEGQEGGEPESSFLWIVAVARSQILAAPSQAVAAEIDQLLDGV